MYDAEALGFLKLDILGLTTLTQIDRALTFIPETDRPVLSQLPDYDQTTFYVIGHYSLEGIFQFESQSGRDLAHEMKPESRRELVDCIALNRPGPAQYRSTYLARRSGNEPVEYPHDDLSKILGDTYGLIIYQEQVMAIARTIGGFSWAEADRMRKAMGKKKPELMKTLEKKFVEGAVDNGYERKWSSGLFEKLAKFAEYGFNRSHSAAYGEITYQTAYLKAHFPVEFYASLLTVKSNDRDRIGQIRSAMLDDFIPLFSPEINKSMAKFSPEERGVRHGLTAVKHVGSRLAKKIQMESEQNAFDSLEDFFSRISPDLIQTQAFQALSASGFFDPLGIERGVLIDNAESILQEGLKIYSEEESGQENLFAQNKSSFTDPFQFDQDASSKWTDSRLRKAQRQSIGYAETQLALLPYLHLGTFCESNNTQRIGFLEGLNTDETQITFTGLSTKAKQYPYNFDTDKVTTSGQVVIGDFDSTGGREILQKIIPLDEKSTQLKLDICFKSEVSRNNLNDLKTILSANPGSNHVGVSVSESKKTYLLDEKVEFSQSMAYSLKAWGEYNSLRIDTADDVLDSGN